MTVEKRATAGRLSLSFVCFAGWRDERVLMYKQNIVTVYK